MNDGGPAFPHTHIIGINGMLHDTQSIGGMSLRAYFAGQAMQAMLTSGYSFPSAAAMIRDKAEQAGETVEQFVCRNAAKHADAMIAALEVKP